MEGSAASGAPSLERGLRNPPRRPLFRDPFRHFSWAARRQLSGPGRRCCSLATAASVSAWVRSGMGRAQGRFHPRAILGCRGAIASRRLPAWGKAGQAAPIRNLLRSRFSLHAPACLAWRLLAASMPRWRFGRPGSHPAAALFAYTRRLCGAIVPHWRALLAGRLLLCSAVRLTARG